MPPKSTRDSTNCNIVGPPADLPSSELPTMRQVLQKCRFVKQNSIDAKLPVVNLTVTVACDLVELWKSVNPSIPLIEKVQQKVKRSYENYLKFKWNNKKTTCDFISKLDKLFDICSCHCSLSTQHSDKCEQNCALVHISCKCPRDQKIPLLELPFMKDQRDKVGPTGKYQLGAVDSLYENKRKRTVSRRERDKCKKVKKPPLLSEPVEVRLSSTSSEDGTTTQVADASYEPPVFAEASSSHRMDLEHMAREADRYGVSDRATAAIATAILIDMGIVTKSDSSKAISRQMVRTARAKARSTAEILGDKPITAVYFDGKKDDTCMKAEDESGVMRYSKEKEEHYVLTSEPDGTYMTHMAPTNGTAPVISDCVCDAMDNLGATETVEVIGSDTTNTMSGTDGGAQHFIETRLDKNLFRVLCLLHTNELPLRKLFIHLDGKTSGKDSFSGPIGKTLKIVNSFKVKDTFTAMTAGDSIPILPDEVYHDFSWDQKCLYKLLHALRSGKSYADIINMKLGGLNHSRWLTLAIRVLYLYMCHHNLSEEDTAKLHMLVHFIMTNYGPMWFNIKKRPLITDAPKHIFQQTKLLQLLPQNVVDIVKPTVTRSAYHAHPENLLISMLDDDDELVRRKAVSIIQDIRLKTPVPSTGRPVRPFKAPKLLYDADTYHDIIDWEKETLTEPPLTYNLSDDELVHIVEEPLNVPPYRSHTQSVERAIRQVSIASTQAYDIDSHRGIIKSKLKSIGQYKKGDTRAQLLKML